MSAQAEAGRDPEVVILGAGPAGLSAALNLVRAHRRVLVVDSNRPRNAATLAAHGFLTRDGISPLELRALGRKEFEAYPDARFMSGIAESVRVEAEGIVVTVRGQRGSEDRTLTVPAVVIATGLTETMPAIPSIRAYYGTHLHSCIQCDAYEKSHKPIALIGETDDLAERALLLSQYSEHLTVFTCGADVVTADEEAALARRGIRVERRPIDDIVGEKATMTGIRLADDEVIACTGGFVRPHWEPSVAFLEGVGVRRGSEGYLETDADGRTGVPGLYAAGDVTRGPQQLIVAAGEGALVAAAVNRDRLGSL